MVFANKRKNLRKLPLPRAAVDMASHYGIALMFVVVLSFLNLADCNDLQNVTMRRPRPQQKYGSRYSADELLMSQFEFKVSEDIDMDPCKSGMYECLTNNKMLPKKVCKGIAI